MNYIIKGRKPASLFRYFEEISAIPRGSYNESGIADYLVRFAEERGLEYYRDALHNVLIKAPASKGMEQNPPLMLQGHTDMVCEKNHGVEHDFEKDPLKLYLDGQYLRAEGTTLGADNGVAVAVMMALLDGEIEQHPAYECLFTSAEETGLDGAQGFDYSRVTARRMINLDNEDLPVVTVGCSGGMRSDLTLRIVSEPTVHPCLRVQIKGMAGGHSGVDINSGRGNANKLMARVLAELSELTELRIVSIVGGSKENAIPRECEAIISVEDEATVLAKAVEIEAQIKRELSAEDRGFVLLCEPWKNAPTEAMTLADTRRLLTLLNCIGVGVLKMSEQVKGLVEWSRNMGVIEQEADVVTLRYSTRSSLEAQLEASRREFDLMARLTDCEVTHYGFYPGWSYAEVSPLRDAYLQTYREVMGESATVDVIHAGLECGVISAHVPDMDMIAIGPNMKNVHSPDEALDLDSVETFWRVLRALVEKG